VFLDSTGRSYSLPAHELPSAKGHGEPVTSSLTLPPGASFVGVMMGDPDDLWLLRPTTATASWSASRT
jgi:topoisomerase-4 subunit A